MVYGRKEAVVPTWLFDNCNCPVIHSLTSFIRQKSKSSRDMNRPPAMSTLSRKTTRLDGLIFFFAFLFSFLPLEVGVHSCNTIIKWMEQSGGKGRHLTSINNHKLPEARARTSRTRRVIRQH